MSKSRTVLPGAVRLHRFYGVGLVCVLSPLCLSSRAGAETASYPVAPPSEPASTAPLTTQAAPPAAAATSTALEPPNAAIDPAAWNVAYRRARAAMADGHFGLAASSFAELERSATTAEQRALCGELESLARQWANAQLTLAPLGQSQPHERIQVRLNQRTTDEISVLYLNAVMYGLGTGVWLAAQTKPDNAASAILPAFGLAGAAAGAVALVDSSGHLGYGVPASAVTGLYIGLEEGITWSIWNQARSPYFDEWQGQTVATVIWGSATIGAIAGAAVGATAGTTPGRASYVGSTALWGGLFSGLLSGALSSDDQGQRDDHALLGAAIGTNLGTLAGVLTAGPLSPSVARVRFMDLGGISGGLLASGLYVSFQDKSSGATTQGLLGVTALGIAAGLATAAGLTQGMPADRGMTTVDKPSDLSLEPMLLPMHGGTLIGAVGTF